MVKKNKVLATKTISFLHSCLLHSSPAISMSQRLLQRSIGLTKCYLFRENSKSRVLFSLPFLEFFLLCLLFTYAHDYSFFFHDYSFHSSISVTEMPLTKFTTEYRTPWQSLEFDSLSLQCPWSNILSLLRKITSGKWAHWSLILSTEGVLGH